MQCLVYSAVLMDMFMELYIHITSELTYAAEVAELEYGMDITCRGLTLAVKGFSHKLHVMINCIWVGGS